MKILLATHNQAKVDEYKKYLKYLFNIEIVSLDELNITDEIDETGRSFKENALLKAQFYGDTTGIISLGDDGGLEIHALNNEPGIYSRRWPGYRAGDEALIDYTLDRMRDIPAKKRTANFTSGAALYNPETKQYVYFEERLNGYITDEKPKEFIPGYPFRAIFYVPEYSKLLQELSEDEHEVVNHRKKICNNIIKYIQNNY